MSSVHTFACTFSSYCTALLTHNTFVLYFQVISQELAVVGAGVEQPLLYVTDLLLPSVDDDGEMVKARVRLASAWGEQISVTLCPGVG